MQRNGSHLAQGENDAAPAVWRVASLLLAALDGIPLVHALQASKLDQYALLHIAPGPVPLPHALQAPEPDELVLLHTA